MRNHLCTEIAALPHITALADLLQQQHPPATPATTEHLPLLRVAPLITAARPPFIAALAAAPAAAETPVLLYAVGTSEQALRVASDLAQWLTPEQVLAYPASDAMPYERMSPATALLRQRLHVLMRLAALQEQPPTREHPLPLLIVAPIRALLQPTLTPPELAQAALTLQAGTTLTQDSLLRRCIDMGYSVVAMVQQPGQLARRGGLVDIWPTADAEPLRIEWFGDELDSLRRFDASSQRSEHPLQRVVISPPHEIPFWHRGAALERLHNLATDNLRPESCDEWQHCLGLLEAGTPFEGHELFAPFFRTEGTGYLLEHLPAGSAVLFSEATLLAHEVADSEKQAEEHRAALVEAGELPADFPATALQWHHLLAPATGRHHLLDLSNNEALESGLLPAQHHPCPTFATAELFGGQIKRLVSDIAARLQRDERVVVVSEQSERLHATIEEALPDDARRPLFYAATLHESGWRLPDLALTLYTDTEVVGWQQRRSLAERQRRRQQSNRERAAFLRSLKPGDYVVHIEHGIAIYDGMVRRTTDAIERDYLTLRYASNDRLYVPVDQVDRVTRYIGTGDAQPHLTRLGTQEWERAKRKARAAVRDMANELVAIYAQRQYRQGYAFSPDTTWQLELEQAFPYIETGDQLRSLDEVKRDMESSSPMDRLLCGDVGFGKTEVAMRVGFKAIQDSKQVAVLVPTTVLAQQHYESFRARMNPFPVQIEMLSRFRTPREQDAILQRLAHGSIDIIIGTHRLLSSDVRFKDLGLLIVDEEQRFGVRHKERLKQLRSEVDVLTLTATPIPRTLHMALSGIRDMSIINTPPEERVPIKTYVVAHDDHLIRDAIRREIDRGGQVYFVHNRVRSIYHVANRLGKLVPEARIGVAHGQLDERQLEQVMLDFFSGAHDVLVCTTIIENGLDVPNANTMIIDNAPLYGLAQLYQLRGRVGRSAARAYAYMLYKRDHIMTEEAKQRLQAIQEATELGAGFRVAMRDLEIRGAGNLLGAEQSGHIAAVGFDLYSRLLEQAITQLKETSNQQMQTLRERGEQGKNGEHGEDAPAATAQQQRQQVAALTQQKPPVVDEKVLVSPLVTLDLPLTAYLPHDYIPDETMRLSIYQHMAEAQTPEEVQALRVELRDRFGEPPEPAVHLLTWLHIKALALAAGVSSVVATKEEFIVRLPEQNRAGRERVRRRFGRDTTLRIGPQFLRLDRRQLRNDWAEKLIAVLALLGDDVAITAQPGQRRGGR